MDNHKKHYRKKDSPSVTHLDVETIAMFADAIIFDKVDNLPIGLSDHVEECQYCKKEILAVCEAIKNNPAIIEVKSHPYFDAPQTEHKRQGFNVSFRIKLVASILAIAGLASLLYYAMKPSSQNYSSQNHRLISDSLSLSTTFKENKDVANVGNSIGEMEHLPNNSSPKNTKMDPHLKESDFFENLIASNYRSTDMEVVSPLRKQQFSRNDAITFKLKGDFSVPMGIIIYNNEGKSLFRKDTIPTPAFKPGLKLLPGIYYWKLQRDNNLLYVGKFYVK